MARLSKMILAILFVIPGLVHAKDCYWQAKNDQIRVDWTAYKTTEKVGVKGEFQQFYYVAGKGDSLKDFFSGLVFNINVDSMSTGDVARDKNILYGFFKKALPDKHLKGFVNSVQGDDQSGQLDIVFGFNKKSQIVPLKYSMKESQLKATGPLHLKKVDLGAALKSLHKVCYELHKGEDGVSKTWDVVDLEITAEMEKVCK